MLLAKYILESGNIWIKIWTKVFANINICGFAIMPNLCIVFEKDAVFVDKSGCCGGWELYSGELAADIDIWDCRGVLVNCELSENSESFYFGVCNFSNKLLAFLFNNCNQISNMLNNQNIILLLSKKTLISIIIYCDYLINYTL